MNNEKIICQEVAYQAADVVGAQYRQGRREDTVKINGQGHLRIVKSESDHSNKIMIMISSSTFDETSSMK